MDRESCQKKVEELKLNVERIKARFERIRKNSEGNNKLEEILKIQCVDSKAPSRHPCNTTKAKGYFSDSNGVGEIVLCTKALRSSDDLKRILLHESTHALDYMVNGLDLTKLDPLACSEIRAAKYGECGLKSNILYDIAPFKFLAKTWQKHCAKEHAIRSTKLMFGEKSSQESVTRQLDYCFDIVD